MSLSSVCEYLRLKNLVLFSYFLLLILTKTHGFILNETIYVSDLRSSKFTIDELLNGHFSYKISDDIDMDPCKAGKAISFIEKNIWNIYKW